jgi:hypothetical protein
MNKMKYSSYTADFKVNIIDYAEKYGSRAAIHEFTQSECNVYYWRQQKNAFLQTTKKSREAVRGLESGKFPEFEDEILEYVRGLCSNGVGVSHKMYAKACKIAIS